MLLPIVTGSCPLPLSMTHSTAGRGWVSWSEMKKTEFPCQLEWQNFQEGHYTIGNRALYKRMSSELLSRRNEMD